MFPRPSRPIKGGSRNSGAAKGSPAPERDRQEEGARSLARWGFSRVLPGLKDVPGEAAAGAWGPCGSGGRGGISGIPRPAAARRQRGLGPGAEVGRASCSETAGPGVRASLPAVGEGRVSPGPAPTPNPPPRPRPRRPAPHPGRPRRRGPSRGCPGRPCPPVPAFRCPPPVCSAVPFSSGLKY